MRGPGVEGFFGAAGVEVGGDFEAGGVAVDVAVGEEARRRAGQLADAGVVLGKRRPVVHGADGGVHDAFKLAGDALIGLGIDHAGEQGPGLGVDEIAAPGGLVGPDAQAVVVDGVDEMVAVPSRA